MENKSTDRYTSFNGIACDENADKLIALLDKSLKVSKGARSWQPYFYKKRSEQQQMNNDNLHFVGSQINVLFEYFSECNDEAALQLLTKIEDECC